MPVDQALNPKRQDSRAIKHHGPNPFYGSQEGILISFLLSGPAIRAA